MTAATSVCPEGASRTVDAVGQVSLARVLWACDFSTCSSAALQAVLPIARAYGSHLTALHVIPASAPPATEPTALTNPVLLLPRLGHDASARLDRSAAAALQASVETGVALRVGAPAEEILGLATALPADLVVLGAHGQRLMPRGMLGSTAEAVVGRARCPVMIVPATAAARVGGRLKTILWATDFSSHAARALRYAETLAARNHALLLLLHVVGGDLISTTSAVRRANARLRPSLLALQDEGSAAEAVVTVGNCASEVVRVAREREADLIAMGVEGSHTLHRLLFGSVTHRVMREAPCAVLAVRNI